MMPDATVVAVQIFSYPKSGAGGARWLPDDLVDALTAVRTAADNLPLGTAPRPCVVNASLGGSQFISTCDSQPGVTAIATQVENLLSRGIPFVAATGNSQSNNAISSPACIRAAIKVSAVRNLGNGDDRLPKANIANPAMFGDSDPNTFDGPILLAPGGSVPDSNPGVLSSSSSTATSMARFSGTSMAAPHVSGMLAGVKAASPGASVADCVAWVLSTGSIEVDVPLNPPSAQTTPFRRIRYPGP